MRGRLRPQSHPAQPRSRPGVGHGRRLLPLVAAAMVLLSMGLGPGSSVVAIGGAARVDRFGDATAGRVGLAGDVASIGGNASAAGSTGALALGSLGPNDPLPAAAL